MKIENSERNGLEHVPACATWPPPWLAETSGPAGKPTPAPSTGTAAKPATLSLELRERWEERVSIMHHDGGLPLPDAEKAALADVLNLYGESEDIGPIRG